MPIAEVAKNETANFIHAQGFHGVTDFYVNPYSSVKEDVEAPEWPDTLEFPNTTDRVFFATGINDSQSVEQAAAQSGGSGSRKGIKAR
jgi:hypothetical protein